MKGCPTSITTVNRASTVGRVSEVAIRLTRWTVEPVRRVAVRNLITFSDDNTEPSRQKRNWNEVTTAYISVVPLHL